MKTLRFILFLLLCVAPVTGACHRSGEEDAKKVEIKKYPDGVEGLEVMLRDLIATIQKGNKAQATATANTLWFKDPSAWFAATYGGDVGATLREDYKHHARSDALLAVISDQLKKGRVELRVEKFEAHEDPQATGYQSIALREQVQPVALYSARFFKPGEKSGFHLCNFVRAEDGWRLAGIMKQLNPSFAADPKLDAVSSLRNADRERFFETGKLPE